MCWNWPLRETCADTASWFCGNSVPCVSSAASRTALKRCVSGSGFRVITRLVQICVEKTSHQTSSFLKRGDFVRKDNWGFWPTSLLGWASGFILRKPIWEQEEHYSPVLPQANRFVVCSSVYLHLAFLAVHFLAQFFSGSRPTQCTTVQKRLWISLWYSLLVPVMSLHGRIRLHCPWKQRNAYWWSHSSNVI